METAPEAPIIGRKTAIGTARTTARTGPCSRITKETVQSTISAKRLSRRRAEAYLVAGALIDLHWHSENRLGCFLEIVSETPVCRLNPLTKIGRLFSVSAPSLLDLLVREIVEVEDRFAARRTRRHLPRESFSGETLRKVATENVFRLFEDDLRPVREFRSNVDRFESRLLRERLSPLL